jgi:hypothetical protein
VWVVPLAGLSAVAKVAMSAVSSAGLWAVKLADVSAEASAVT